MAPPPEVAARRQTQGPDKLGEQLVKSGKINQVQLQEALALQKDQGGRLVPAFVLINSYGW